MERWRKFQEEVKVLQADIDRFNKENNTNYGMYWYCVDGTTGMVEEEDESFETMTDYVFEKWGYFMPAKKRGKKWKVIGTIEEAELIFDESANKNLDFIQNNKSNICLDLTECWEIRHGFSIHKFSYNEDKYSDFFNLFTLLNNNVKLLNTISKLTECIDKKSSFDFSEFADIIDNCKFYVNGFGTATADLQYSHDECFELCIDFKKLQDKNAVQILDIYFQEI